MTKRMRTTFKNILIDKGNELTGEWWLMNETIFYIFIFQIIDWFDIFQFPINTHQDIWGGHFKASNENQNILSITLTILKHFRSVINVNGYKNELHVKWVKKSSCSDMFQHKVQQPQNWLGCVCWVESRNRKYLCSCVKILGLLVCLETAAENYSKLFWQNKIRL